MNELRMDRKAYNKIENAAKAAVKGYNKEPQKGDFKADSDNGYGKVLNYLLWGSLAVVALLAFVFSAGKQIVASDAVLLSVQESSNRLSPAWTDVAIIAMLGLGEIGSVLFSFFAALYPGDPVTLFQWSLNFGLQGFIFRVVAISCALVALVANVSITIIHAGSFYEVGLFGGMTAVIPPLIILAVAYAGEAMVLKMITAKKEELQRYNIAKAKWELIQEDPTQHPRWRKTFYGMLFDELWKMCSEDQRIELQSLEDQEKTNLVYSIVREHTDWYDLQPTEPANPTPGQPSLKAGLTFTSLGLSTDKKEPTSY